MLILLDEYFSRALRKNAGRIAAADTRDQFLIRDCTHKKETQLDGEEIVLSYVDPRDIVFLHSFGLVRSNQFAIESDWCNPKRSHLK